MSVDERRLFTDRQALGIIGAWLVLQTVTGRIGLVLVPALLTSAPPVIPLVKNRVTPVLLAAADSRRSLVLLFAVGFTSFLMSTVSGLVLYWAGKRFGLRVAEWGAARGRFWSRIWNPKRVARACAWHERWGIAPVAVTRAVGALNSPVSLVAGSSRMPLKRYALAQMGGSVVWVAAVMWLGVKTGDQWPWLTDRIEGYASWGIGIALAALGLFVAGTLLSRARRGRRASAAAQTSV